MTSYVSAVSRCCGEQLIKYFPSISMKYLCGNYLWQAAANPPAHQPANSHKPPAKVQNRTAQVRSGAAWQAFNTLSDGHRDSDGYTCRGKSGNRSSKIVFSEYTKRLSARCSAFIIAAHSLISPDHFDNLSFKCNKFHYLSVITRRR